MEAKLCGAFLFILISHKIQCIESKNSIMYTQKYSTKQQRARRSFKEVWNEMEEMKTPAQSASRPVFHAYWLFKLNVQRTRIQAHIYSRMYCRCSQQFFVEIEWLSTATTKYREGERDRDRERKQREKRERNERNMRFCPCETCQMVKSL